MTFWSFLFLLSAVSVAALQFFVKSSIKSDGKTCPHCGKPVEGDISFCMFCGGSLKIEPDIFVNCVNCGFKVKKGTAVCPNCGKDPSKVVEPDTFINCVNCGAKVKKGTETCPSCGKDPGKVVEPPEPFFNCVHCDTLVKKGTAICPVCGKNPSEKPVSVTYNFFTEPDDL